MPTLLVPCRADENADLVSGIFELLLSANWTFNAASIFK